MAFGICNVPVTFQHLITDVLVGVLNCQAYLDDLVICSHTRQEHIELLETVFRCLSRDHLTLNLVKCEFGKATVTYLGKKFGQGQVHFIDAKVEAKLSSFDDTSQARPFTGNGRTFQSVLSKFLYFYSSSYLIVSPASVPTVGQMYVNMHLNV